MLAPVPNSPAPRMDPSVLGRPDEVPAVSHRRTKPRPKPPSRSNSSCRGRLDLEGQHQAGEGSQVRLLLEGSDDRLCPPLVDHHVVVGERDDFGRGLHDRPVAGVVESGPRFDHIVESRVPSFDETGRCVSRWGVVNDEDAYARRERAQRRQAAFEGFGTVACAHGDGHRRGWHRRPGLLVLAPQRRRDDRLDVESAFGGRALEQREQTSPN